MFSCYPDNVFIEQAGCRSKSEIDERKYLQCHFSIYIADFDPKMF